MGAGVIQRSANVSLLHAVWYLISVRSFSGIVDLDCSILIFFQLKVSLAGVNKLNAQSRSVSACVGPYPSLGFPTHLLFPKRSTIYIYISLFWCDVVFLLGLRDAILWTDPAYPSAPVLFYSSSVAVFGMVYIYCIALKQLLATLARWWYPKEYSKHGIAPRMVASKYCVLSTRANKNN